MLEHWLLDPSYTYLNHGTVGAPPKRVLEKQQALRDEMERQPSRFMLRELNLHQPAPWRTKSRLPERQATLHHPVASWGSGGGFREEFERTATSDATSFLAAPEGLALLEEWNFEAVLAYNY
jgi:hypothetical protein